MKNKGKLFFCLIGVSISGILMYEGIAKVNGIRNILFESIFIIPLILILTCFFYLSGKKRRKK